MGVVGFMFEMSFGFEVGWLIWSEVRYVRQDECHCAGGGALDEHIEGVAAGAVVGLNLNKSVTQMR